MGRQRCIRTHKVITLSLSPWESGLKSIKKTENTRVCQASCTVLGQVAKPSHPKGRVSPVKHQGNRSVSLPKPRASQLVQNTDVLMQRCSSQGRMHVELVTFWRGYLDQTRSSTSETWCGLERALPILEENRSNLLKWKSISDVPLFHFCSVKLLSFHAVTHMGHNSCSVDRFSFRKVVKILTFNTNYSLGILGCYLSILIQRLLALIQKTLSDTNQTQLFLLWASNNANRVWLDSLARVLRASSP